MLSCRRSGGRIMCHRGPALWDESLGDGKDWCCLRPRRAAVVPLQHHHRLLQHPYLLPGGVQSLQPLFR